VFEHQYVISFIVDGKNNIYIISPFLACKYKSKNHMFVFFQFVFLMVLWIENFDINPEAWPEWQLHLLAWPEWQLHFLFLI
jgi:hypothetical protein